MPGLENKSVGHFKSLSILSNNRVIFTFITVVYEVR
jgi:hypothetical protein